MDRWPQAVAFDIFETVFSIEPLRERLMSLGLPPASLESWFAVGVRDALTLATKQRFELLRDVLESALDQILACHRLTALPVEKAHVLEGLKALVPHAGTEEGLRVLRTARVRILALSNGAPSVIEHLLRAAGIAPYFEAVVPSKQPISRSL